MQIVIVSLCNRCIDHFFLHCSVPLIIHVSLIVYSPIFIYPKDSFYSSIKDYGDGML